MSTRKPGLARAGFRRAAAAPSAAASVPDAALTARVAALEDAPPVSGLPDVPAINGTVLTRTSGVVAWRPFRQAASGTLGNDDNPYSYPPIGEEPTITAPPGANPYHFSFFFATPTRDVVFPVAAGAFEGQTIVFHRNAVSEAFSVGVLCAGATPLAFTFPPGVTGGNVQDADGNPIVGQDAISWDGASWNEAAGTVPAVEAPIFDRVEYLETHGVAQVTADLASLGAAVAALPVGATPVAQPILHVGIGDVNAPPAFNGNSLFIPVQPDVAGPCTLTMTYWDAPLDQLVIISVVDGNGPEGTETTGGTVVIVPDTFSGVLGLGWSPKTLAVGESAAFRWRGVARGWVLLTDPPAAAIPDATDEASAVTAVNALLALARADGRILP
jgi:hypothetical protein